MFLRNLLLFDLSILLFLSLSKELAIDCSNKNVDKIENTNKKTSLEEDANRETDFEILEDADLYWMARTLSRYSKATIKLKNSRSRMLSR